MFSIFIISVLFWFCDRFNNFVLKNIENIKLFGSDVCLDAFQNISVDSNSDENLVIFMCHYNTLLSHCKLLSTDPIVWLFGTLFVENHEVSGILLLDNEDFFTFYLDINKRLPHGFTTTAQPWKGSMAEGKRFVIFLFFFCFLLCFIFGKNRGKCCDY